MAANYNYNNHSITRLLSLLWYLPMISCCGARHFALFVGRFPTVAQYSQHIHRKTTTNKSYRMASNPSDDDDDDNDTSLEEKIDTFLDKPFFDPNSPSNDDNWFANLVKNDYDSAEALYVGVVVIFGVIVSQELLRIVKYGDGLGATGVGGGKLF